MLEQVDFNNTNFYNGMQVFHIDVFYCSHAHKAIYFIIYIYNFIRMMKVRELLMLLMLIIVSS